MAPRATARVARTRRRGSLTAYVTFCRGDPGGRPVAVLVLCFVILENSMRLISRSILVVIALIVVGVGALGISYIARARNDQNVPISGQNVPLLKYANYVGTASSQQQLDLSIGLKLRNQQELDTLLNNIYNPKSSLYHHFLTPQQFSAEFAPTTAQQQQVIAYLRGRGIAVSHVASNGLFLDAQASVATVQTAFGVKINNY